jgi:plasmid stability protein
MATLYVENIPDELYKALRERARRHRKSIAAEILTLLQENIPTADELKKRRKIFKQLERLRAAAPPAPGPLPTSEEMQREDRER